MPWSSYSECWALSQHFHSLLSLSQQAFKFLFTFFHKGGIICISEVADISPGNLDSSLCFFQPSCSHDGPCSVQFSSVHSLSRVWLYATAWTAARQASLAITNSQSSLRLTSIKSVMPSSHLILGCPFSSCPQSFPTSESFPMSQLFKWGGQTIGVSGSASVLSMNTQDWSPLGWTGWISLQSKGLSRVLSNTTVQKHKFFSTPLSSQSNSHIHTWPQKKP